MMVQEKTKGTFAAWRYDFNLADETAHRAANLLFARWMKNARTHKDKMDEVFLRLEQLAEYLQRTNQDEYLDNLSVVLMGCRLQGISLRDALKKMEKVRVIIADCVKEKTLDGLAASGVSPLVFDGSPQTKLKYVLRRRAAEYLLFELQKILNEGRTELNHREKIEKRLAKYRETVAENIVPLFGNDK